jgi:DNA-binding transcriptional ArsR family regulator
MMTRNQIVARSAQPPLICSFWVAYMPDRTEKAARHMSRAGTEAMAKRRAHAGVFAALADETRLGLITALAGGERRSIAQLTGGTRLTRQAVTKHLRVLEAAGLVRSVRTGRENVFEFDPSAVHDLREYLGRLSERSDPALARLKSLAEA